MKYLSRSEEGQGRDGRLVRGEGGVGEARGGRPELHLGVVPARHDGLLWCFLGVVVVRGSWLVLGGGVGMVWALGGGGEGV